MKSKQQGSVSALHASFIYSWIPKPLTHLEQSQFSRAYDRAAIRFNGPDAVTNFDSCSYDGDVPLPPEIEKDGTIGIFCLVVSTVH